ncbi:MAG TPA: methionyl-tRNA formyltransferase [Candidatus Fimousia stercorigallinarum]|nr:methionyl-tRNA formyltransferase [Candidatus Fimousia stercorigallinarum]
MRVVFMGTPDFAVPTLQAMIDHYDVIAVVTQPDKPKGRGKSVAFSPVKEKALEYKIPVYQPVKAREPEFVEKLKKLDPDVIVVVAFGQILSKEILEIPKYGCINGHASLLPMYRGSGPIQWVVINGEKETGITTMRMDEGVDTGDMIEKVVVPIDSKETGGSLFDKLKEVSAQLMVSTLKKIENGTAVYTPQGDGKTCYAPMLTKKMGDIDFSKPAQQIECLIRGLNPWPSAYTKLHGKSLKVWDADVVKGRPDVEPGTILEVTKETIIVQTGEDALALREIQLAGKKRMNTSAFLLGYRVSAGEKLGE